MSEADEREHDGAVADEAERLFDKYLRRRSLVQLLFTIGSVVINCIFCILLQPLFTLLIQLPSIIVIALVGACTLEDDGKKVCLGLKSLAACHFAISVAVIHLVSITCGMCFKISIRYTEVGEDYFLVGRSVVRVVVSTVMVILWWTSACLLILQYKKAQKNPSMMGSIRTSPSATSSATPSASVSAITSLFFLIPFIFLTGTTWVCHSFQ